MKFCKCTFSFHIEQMIKTFIPFRITRGFALGKHRIKFHGNKAGIDHRIFGRSRVYTDSVEFNQSTACIKILVLNFIFCISVQCVCKISTELINIKMRCTSSSFFIWGKCDAKRAMRYILFVHSFNHSQNFCNTSFVISTKNCCSVACNQCAFF